MAEDQFGEQIIPGTYVRVQAEGLISAGGISSGNIGIVGTAEDFKRNKPDGTEETVKVDHNKTYNLSDYSSTIDNLGPYDAYDEGKGVLNLTRGLELLFRSGARTVYARALVKGDADKPTKYTAAFIELLKDDVNILVAPQLSTHDAKTVLGSLVDTAESEGKDLIAVIGSDKDEAADITAQVVSNKRVIMTGPGICVYDSAAESDVNLNGRYSAAAVAGLISSLAVQSSPTNKALSGVNKLTKRFSYVEMKKLVKGGVLALEERRGVRVVRGITTHGEGEAFSQVTTRRITDYAKAGIRQVSNPFIGKLNNERVRKAMYGAIDGFLATMRQDESLTFYQLEVTATRQQEIAGQAIVNVLMQPTFSIDYIRVTLSLQ